MCLIFNEGLVSLHSPFYWHLECILTIHCKYAKPHLEKKDFIKDLYSLSFHYEQLKIAKKVAYWGLHPSSSTLRILDALSSRGMLLMA